MGTRTWSRKGILTIAGMRRAGLISEQTIFSGDDIDKSLSDPLFSMETQMSIYDAEDVVRDILAKSDDGDDTGLRRAFALLKLDPNNDEDIAIFTALASGFGSRNRSGEDVAVFEAENNRITASFETNEASTGREINIYPDRVEITNHLFRNNRDASRGQGTAMIIRQTWAARQIGERLGLPVKVEVKALELDDDFVGISVWPKIGYDFNLNDEKNLLEEVKRLGFRSENTADLMREVNKDGILGYDVWDMVVREVKNNIRAIEMVGVMTPTNNNDVGLRVTMEYGKRKNIIKNDSSGFIDDIFRMSSAENALLREAWLSI